MLLRSRTRRIAVAAVGIVSLAEVARADSAGTEFWLAFESNGADGAAVSVQILGASGTTGTVAIPGLAFSAPFSIPVAGLTTVSLPAGAIVATSDGVEDRGVHVTANRAVVVYGLDIQESSADTFLALPLPALGVAYDAITYTPTEFSSSQLAVVATADGTQLSVTPTAAIGARPSGATYEITLDAGEVYQAASSGDLSGTKLAADYPIAVFSGNPWAFVPVGASFADHLVEQLAPTAAWGTDVFAIPSASRLPPERLRIQASEPSTLVTISTGGDVTLGPGQVVENPFSVATRFQAVAPISISQFAVGGSNDGGAGDPFLLIPLPVERFERCFLVATADGGTLFPNNFVNLVVSSTGAAGIALDGVPLAPESFGMIGATGYAYRQLAITPGAHVLTGTEAFGASVYGFGSYVSYGTAAGGASPPYPSGLEACPEPTSLATGAVAVAALATVASRRRRSRRHSRSTRHGPMCCMILGASVAAAPAAAQVDADVAKIQACVARNMPRVGRQDVHLTMQDDAGSRTLEAIAFWKPDEQGRTRLLYWITAPSDVRGSAFLFREREGAHDIWTYLPETRAVRRIPASGVSVPFFGSDFSYEDVLELQAEARYAKVEQRLDAELDGRAVRVLSAKPIFEESAYGEIVSSIDAETCVVLRVALYDAAGAMVKEMRVAWPDVRREGDVWRPGVVSMRDLVRGTSSRLAFERGAWDAEIPDRLFQPNELAKGP